MFRAFWPACRGEAGNLSYVCYLAENDPDGLLLMEKWKDMDALMAHAKQTHMAGMDELKAEHVADMKLEMLREV
ncbi:MAG: antibiotic biosynthesis monooxygenase [Oscillospiraceae bacterium]|nr:antibiotic biosynthesis monooxygenase [Oscillospiraceae bacterium]